MRRKMPMIALGVLTAGLLAAEAAQSPADSQASTSQQPQQQQAGQNEPAHNRAVRSRAAHERRGPQYWQDHMLQRMMARLSLTADQQNQIKTILKQARADNKALLPQFREEKMALDDAVKTDSPRAIDQITRANEHLNTQVASNRLKTVAKIYALLTPDQKAKFDQRFDQVMGLHLQKGGV